jgi:phosphatidylglycerophosphatase GEP4
MRGQSLNTPAIASTLRVLFREPSLLLPHVAVDDIRSLSFAALRRRGFDAVLFDKDNTLTAPYARSFFPGLEPSVQRCLRAFGEERVAIISNSAGSSDDVGYAEADAVEAALGLRVVRHGTKKPNGLDEVLAHFGGVRADRIVMIGDRALTDVVFGNMCAMATVQTGLLTAEGDNWVAAKLRPLEARLAAAARRRGVLPPPHSRVELVGAREAEEGDPIVVAIAEEE